MNKKLTRRELAQQRQIFAGRQQQLEDFQRNLTLPLADPNRKFIWAVSGQGGIGKSTLLRRYRELCHEHHCLTALVDEYTPNSVLGVMAVLAEQLEAAGHPLEGFVKRYRVYQQHQKQMEADPERPTGFAQAIGKGSGRVLNEVFKTLPGGALVPGLLGEDFIIDKSGELAAFVARKISNKDDVRLVLEPVKELTPLFVENLSTLAEHYPIALYLDTYERTATYLDIWLRDVLEGKYGDLALEVLIVIAGHYELGQAWLHDMILPLLEQVRLEPFSEAEARDYLTRQDIVDEKVVDLLLHLSGRVPVLLTTLATNLPENLDQLGDPTGSAIDRFLKWVSDETQRQAVLTCALPRRIDLDVVGMLLGAEQAEAMFPFVKGMSFVSQRAGSGWVYHATVRELMLRYRRIESHQHWQTLHTHLADYFAGERDSLRLALKDGLRDANWQRADLDWLYHTICAHGRGAEETWVRRVLDTFANVSPNDYNRALAETIREAGHDLDEADIKLWGQKCIDGFVANLDERSADALPMFNALVTGAKTLDADYQAIAYQKRGLTYRDMQNYATALPDLTHVIELQPDDGNNYFWRGLTYHDMQNYTAALPDCTRAIELQPDDGYNYFFRGLTYRDMQNYTAALPDFTRAIELQPENGNNYSWRGRIHRDMQNYTAALPDFTRAIELQPENGNNYSWRGRIHRDMQNYAAALPDLTHVIELQPDDGNNYFWRGYTYRDMQNYAAALSDFTRAIELQPDDSSNYSLRGLTYRDMQNYVAALPDFTRAIELQPENGNYYSSRGRTHRDMQNHTAALSDFTRAIELQPDDGSNYFWRGYTYRDMQNYTAALPDFTRAIELQPDDGNKYFWRGSTYRDMRNYMAALPDFTRAIELQPDDGSNYSLRGRTYRDTQNYVAALPDFTRAIELKPENSNNYFWRGLTYLNMQNYTAALSDFTRAIELQPDDGYNYFWRGLTYHDMQNYVAALPDFTRAIDLQPDDGNNYFWRGLTLLASGDYNGALTALNRAAELPSLDSATVFWRSIAYQLVGDKIQAESDLASARALAAVESDSCSQAQTLAHIELLEGHVEMARKQLQRVLGNSCAPDARDRERVMLRELARLFPTNIEIQAMAKWFTNMSSGDSEESGKSE